MKKKSLLVLSGILVLGLLGACGPKEDKSSHGGDNTSHVGESQESQAAEKYKIIVANLPDGISYTIDKTEAEVDEEVTFTLTSVAEAFTIKAVLVNNSPIEGTNNVYKFKMPFGGARISVNYTISGDITIEGEGFACSLTEGADGIFRGTAKVSSSLQVAKFNLMVQGQKQDYYKCYDYVNSFGNIQWPGTAEYGFAVATGCTYEFKYNPAAEVPFSVVRTSVDVLPTDSDSLYRLFSGDAGSGMRDETCNPLNLKNSTYSVTDSSGDEFLNYTYNYKKYENNTSLATIEDLQNEETYYTYKQADLEKDVFTVVDTYPNSLGNNDYFKYLRNPAGKDEYSYRCDLQKDEIIRDGKWFDESRYLTSERYGIRNVNWSAHAGNALEQEIKWAYRVDSTTAVINAASYVDYQVVSTPLADGAFNVKVNSVIENNRSGTGNETEEHDGKIYEIDLNFNKEGNVTGMNYKYTSYPKAKWDFTTHQPTAKVGVTTKITYTAEYGNPNSGKPTFDVDKYFISSINDVTFSNDAAGGDDHVGFGDYVSIHTVEGGDSKALKNFSYAPSTALDAWQYEVVGDSENLLDFTYTKGVAAKVGETNISVTNQTQNSGVKYNKKLTIGYCKSIAQFYFIGTARADECEILSGSTDSFTVKATAVSGYNSVIVPVVYTPKAYVKKTVKDEFGETKVVNEATDLIEFLRTDETLTIKAKAGVTEKTTVYIAMQSDYYAENKSTTVLTCVICPNTFDDARVANTSWKTAPGYFVDKENNPLQDFIQIDFKDTTGTIKDCQYDTKGTLQYTDTYTFEYSQDLIGRITAKITNVDLKSYKLKADFNKYNWNLMIEPSEGRIGLALLYTYKDFSVDDAGAVFGDWGVSGDEEYGYEYECTLMEALDKVK